MLSASQQASAGRHPAADARGAALVRRHKLGMPSLLRSLPELVSEMSSSGLVNVAN